MKAKDLAAFLLQNPDADVFYEGYNSPDFGDGYHFTESVTGIQITPSGVFINTEYLEHDTTMAPADKPQIGTVRILMDDDVWFRFGDSGCNTNELRSFIEYGYISNYVDWHSGTWTLTTPDYSDDYIDDIIKKIDNTHYTTDNIKSVEIITEVPEDTWKPVWQKFKWDEALEFVKRGIV